MNRILKLLVDLLYGTNDTRKRFELKTKDKVLASDMSKGIITKQNTDIKRGVNWIVSQRAVILLTNSQIICGKWIIPIDTITSATLVKIRTIFGGGQILKIETSDNENYQFGMQVNDEWINQKVLSLTVEKGKVKISAFSWIIRIIAFGYFIYWLLQKFEIVN